MNFLQSILEGEVFRFFLVFARIGGALVFLPGIGEAYIAPRIRLVLALWLSFMLLPMLGNYLPSQPANYPDLAKIITREIAIGVYFGLLTRLYLLGLQFSGMFMATQMGIATALVQDPISTQQSAALSNLLSLSALCLVLNSDIGHSLFKALIATYDLLPAGRALPFQDMAKAFTEMVGKSLILALQIAAPFFIYSLLLFLGLGILSRLMPQLQVFFIAIPLQVIGGLALLALTLGAGLSLFALRYGEMLRSFF